MPDNNFYLLFLLIFPQWDRRTFHVKDFTLVKAICQWLHLAKDSPTEKLLLNWKQHKHKQNSSRFNNNSGQDQPNSLSQLIVQEISKRKKEPTISKFDRINIKQLNDLLDEISQERIINANVNLINSKSFIFCLNNLSFLELNFFFNILLKRKILNGLENFFLTIWHPDAKRYLNIVSNLRVLAETLSDPNKRLIDNDWNIKLSLPFVPQLTKRLINESYDNIINKKLMNNFLMEEKMDGERIQLHFTDFGNKIFFFSRRGINYSNKYGAKLNDNGLITSHLNFLPNVKNCVLDGEMITYDIENNKILPFGIVKSFRSTRGTTKDTGNDIVQNDYADLENDIDTDVEMETDLENISNENYHPLYMIFDLVYLNDNPLINVPLYQRREYLNHILKPKPNFVEILPFQMGTNANSIKSFLAKAIEYNSEGIILKNIYSKYMIGQRIDTWIKIKPEYLENFGENLDLIVIGKIIGLKNSFICALIDLANVKFYSFCTISNGISNSENKEITRRTEKYWKDFKLNPPSSAYLLFGTRKPHKWIDPREFALVLQVKARSIDNTKSNAKNYHVDCTLFNAYCRVIRFDKDWKDCYSLNEFKDDLEFRAHNNLDTNKNLLNGNKSKRAKRRKPNKIRIVGNNFMDTDLVTNIFQNLKFYILSDFFDSRTNDRIDINQLKKKVLANGGTLIYNLILKDPEKIEKIRIISSKKNIECRKLIERGYDIIHPRWIIDCINNGRLLKLDLNYCFHFSQHLLQAIEKRVDSLGDSYTTLINEHDLQEIMDSNDEILTIKDEESLGNDFLTIPHFLFSNRNFYIPNKDNDNSENYLLVMKSKLHGAMIVPQIDDCDLIIVTENNKDCLDAIRKQLSQRAFQVNHVPRVPHIVDAKWVDKCIEENIQVPEEDFPVI